MKAEAPNRNPAKLASVLNRVVATLTRRGVSVFGTRILTVRGRRSGEPRSTPVNPLVVEGDRYLVSPRGETQWVRNLRLAGEGTLRLGNRVESFRAVEIVDREKSTVLREYLRRWKWEVGALFDGVGASATENELRRIAARHPVFRVDTLR